MRAALLRSIQPACLFACLVATLALGTAPAWAEDARMLTVTGQGEAGGAPDEAVLSASVVNTARTAAAALAANARAMTAVFATLKDAGVAEKDIQTSGFSVQPQYADQTNNAPQRLVGYRVTNTVIVRVDDLARLGATLDALVSSGANTIGDIAFGIRNSKPLAAQARAEAVADALARAQALAKAAGVTLGPIASITDGGGEEMRPMGRLMVDRAATPIAAGQQSVTASVTIVWDIR